MHNFEIAKLQIAKISNMQNCKNAKLKNMKNCEIAKQKIAKMPKIDDFPSLVENDNFPKIIVFIKIGPKSIKYIKN